MKKIKLLVSIGICGMFLAACGQEEPIQNETANDPVVEKNEVSKESSSAKTSEEKPKKKVSDKPKDVKLDGELLFGDFTVEMNKYKIYEENGSKFIDVSFTWTNDSFPGEKSLMSASALDAYQGEELLEEKSGVLTNLKSNYFYKNKVGIYAPIKLTYELNETEEPIKIVFVPLNDYDENQEYLIDIK